MCKADHREDRDSTKELCLWKEGGFLQGPDEWKKRDEKDRALVKVRGRDLNMLFCCPSRWKNGAKRKDMQAGPRS